MILFDLKCAKEHVFEAWFRDSEAYDRQAALHEISCPVCGSRKVAKAPMAPRIGKGASAERQTMAMAKTKTMVQTLRKLRAEVEANCDYVGDRFAEEALRIHHGEVDRRNIYGEASDEEAATLGDEGVEFARIPWLPRHDS